MLGCVRSTEEFEVLILQQESDTLQTFFGLSGPYIIQKEYLYLAIKFNTEFSNKTVKGRKLKK